MKTKIILTGLSVIIAAYAAIGFLAYAQEKAQPLRELFVLTNTNANNGTYSIRITSGELFLDGSASMKFEMRNVDGEIFNTKTMLFTSAEVAKFVGAANPTNALKNFVLNKANLTER